MTLIGSPLNSESEVMDQLLEQAKEMTDKMLRDDKDKGLRYNKGKLRYDLEPVYARQEFVRVLTKGAEKYADRNWERGMRWSKVIESMERHVAAFKAGEDFDPETGCLHTAHIMCNAAFLTEYYKIFPEGDNRQVRYLQPKKIGLDIDEVLCDWIGGFINKFGEPSHKFDGINHWNFSYAIPAQYGALQGDELVDFYMGLKPVIDPAELPFEPHCYITNRTAPQEVTEQWLQMNGFPTSKVISLPPNVSKVQAALEAGIEWYVDDRMKNFVELNNAGICTFLMDAPHNRKYNVGYKRIYSLKDLVS